MAAATARWSWPPRSRGQDPRVRVVNFRRNYGQTPAMAAGIEQARGKVLVTMDGDLQNDPRDIEHFLAKINEGYDIVVGWRFNRQDKLVSRKIPSKIANWLIGKVTGVPIKDNGCSLKAYRGVADQGDPAVLRDAPLHPGHGVDRRAADCGDQGAAPRAPVRGVEVRPVARVQGAARPDGHQDRGVVHVATAAMVRAAVATPLAADRHLRGRLLALAAGPHAAARCRCPLPARASSADRLRSSWSAAACWANSSTSSATCASGDFSRLTSQGLGLTDLPVTAARGVCPCVERNIDVELSVIVPVGQPAGRSRATLHAEYKAGLDALGQRYELIFVLDGPREKFAAGLARSCSTDGAAIHGRSA